MPPKKPKHHSSIQNRLCSRPMLERSRAFRPGGEKKTNPQTKTKIPKHPPPNAESRGTSGTNRRRAAGAGEERGGGHGPKPKPYGTQAPERRAARRRCAGRRGGAALPAGGRSRSAPHRPRRAGTAKPGGTPAPRWHPRPSTAPCPPGRAPFPAPRPGSCPPRRGASLGRSPPGPGLGFGHRRPRGGEGEGAGAGAGGAFPILGFPHPSILPSIPPGFGSCWAPGSKAPGPPSGRTDRRRCSGRLSCPRAPAGGGCGPSEAKDPLRRLPAEKLEQNLHHETKPRVCPKSVG